MARHRWFGDRAFRRTKEYKELRRAAENEIEKKDDGEADFSGCKALYDKLAEKDYEAITLTPWSNPDSQDKTVLSDYKSTADWRSMESVEDLENACWEEVCVLIEEQKR